MLRDVVNVFFFFFSFFWHVLFVLPVVPVPMLVGAPDGSVFVLIWF